MTDFLLFWYKHRSTELKLHNSHTAYGVFVFFYHFRDYLEILLNSICWKGFVTPSPYKWNTVHWIQGIVFFYDIKFANNTSKSKKGILQTSESNFLKSRCFVCFWGVKMGELAIFRALYSLMFVKLVWRIIFPCKWSFVLLVLKHV